MNNARRTHSLADPMPFQGRNPHSEITDPHLGGSPEPELGQDAIAYSPASLTSAALSWRRSWGIIGSSLGRRAVGDPFTGHTPWGERGGQWGIWMAAPSWSPAASATRRAVFGGL